MPLTLTKEDLSLMIEEHLKSQLDVMGLSSEKLSDQFQGMMKEAIQESLKDFGAQRKDFFEENPRDDGQGGFDSIEHFAAELIASGENVSRPTKLMEAWLLKADKIKAAGSPTQSASSLEAGGALIPPTFSRIKLEKARERSVIMQKTMNIPMATPVLEIPFIKNFDKSQGLTSGNVRFRWLAEMAQDTANDIEFAMATLTLREATMLIYLSKRMVDFSPISIQPFITTTADEALDTLLEESWLNGTGAGQPLGIMNSNVLVSITKEPSQVANTIQTENIAKLFAQHFGTKSDWFVNKTTFPQLLTLAVDVGTGGSTVGLLKDQNIGGKPGQTIFGIPITYSEYMQTLGTTGDIGLFDWSQYLVGQLAGKGGLITEQSPHLKFDFRQLALQFVIYIDGQPWWPSAYTPRRGDPRSPFTVIATRS